MYKKYLPSLASKTSTALLLLGLATVTHTSVTWASEAPSPYELAEAIDTETSSLEKTIEPLTYRNRETEKTALELAIDELTNSSKVMRLAAQLKRSRGKTARGRLWAAALWMTSGLAGPAFFDTTGRDFAAGIMALPESVATDERSAARIAAYEALDKYAVNVEAPAGKGTIDPVEYRTSIMRGIEEFITRTRIGLTPSHVAVDDLLIPFTYNSEVHQFALGILLKHYVLEKNTTSIEVGEWYSELGSLASWSLVRFDTSKWYNANLRTIDVRYLTTHSAVANLPLTNTSDVSALYSYADALLPQPDRATSPRKLFVVSGNPAEITEAPPLRINAISLHAILSSELTLEQTRLYHTIKPTPARQNHPLEPSHLALGGLAAGYFAIKKAKKTTKELRESLRKTLEQLRTSLKSRGLSNDQVEIRVAAFAKVAQEKLRIEGCEEALLEEEQAEHAAQSNQRRSF